MPCLSFSPDASILATPGPDHEVLLWHPQEGQIAARLPGHVGAITALVFHPREPILISAGQDGSCRHWNWRTKEKVREWIPDPSNHVRAPDGFGGENSIITVACAGLPSFDEAAIFGAFLVVTGIMMVPAFILTEATLALVGLGFPPPTATWGAMLREGWEGRALADAPWLEMDVLSWSRHFRCFPGQGDLPLTDFMEALAATGCAVGNKHSYTMGPDLSMDGTRSVAVAV